MSKEEYFAHNLGKVYVLHIMGNKLCKDLGINHSVKFPGSSVQKYIKNHPQSKGLIYVSCIFYYEEGSTAPGILGIWDNIFHTLFCCTGLHIRQHDSCQVLERPKEERVLSTAAVYLKAMILTISCHFGSELVHLLSILPL